MRSSTEINKMGQKAYRLLVMKDNGICVPEFFCISYEEELKEEELRGRLKSIEDKTEKNRMYSVRSSANCEDAAELSFAGQFKSFLNVREEDLGEKIKACREALHNENVLKYAEDSGIQLEDIRMNVIVQRMIEADCSGVGFSSNPAGLLNETVIVCGEGTGDKVVEDKTETVTYYYNKTDKNYYYEQSSGEIELPEDKITELIETIERISQLFEEPVDVEFTIRNNRLWILQARPITTISRGHRPVILDNSNIVESYPGITLPLTEAFIKQAYHLIFKGVTMRSTSSEKTVDKYREVFKEMIGSANGRIYYKISNWYTLIQLLPFHKRIIPIWQDMMGVTNKELGIGSKRETTFVQSIRIYLNAVRTMFTVSKQMDRLNGSFTKLEEYFKAGFREQMDNSELMELYAGLLDRVFADWDITLLNDMYAFVFTGLLKSRLKKQGFSDEVLIKCISGMSNIESLKPIRELLNISLEVSSCSSLREKFASFKSSSDYHALLVEDKVTGKESQLLRRIEDYLNMYGDRSLEELKLESQTFRESPILLIKKILDYSADREKLLLYIDQLKGTDNNIPMKQKGLNKYITAFLSSKAMKGIRNREISRLNRSRLYGMARKIFLCAGRNLYKKGQIENPADVFYLTVDEVFADNAEDYKVLVEERKTAYEMYGKLPVYSRLVFADLPFNKVHLNINSRRTNFERTGLVGTPCSAGEVVGEALVIDSPSFQVDVKGKILVTRMTDPGWVFLLASAKGIVAEKGSLLSHTAIISRELKIPSVVGVKNITAIVKSGDLIRINGSKGRVEILRSAGGEA